MFPISPNSQSLLAELQRRAPANDTARMAEVFRVFLEQARFGLSGLWEESPATDTGSEWTPLNQHRLMLDWLARRQNFPTAPADPLALPGPVSLPEERTPQPPPALRSIPLLANHAAERHGIPQPLFNRLIWLESEFNPRAVSPKGAMGLGQLMPETAKELGLNLKPEGGPGSVWDPQSNLEASARYLKWLHGQFIDKGIAQPEAWRFAAAAYNAGIGNITRALNRLEENAAPRWEQVARFLPQITGAASSETLTYVKRLRV